MFSCFISLFSLTERCTKTVAKLGPPQGKTFFFSKRLFFFFPPLPVRCAALSLLCATFFLAPSGACGYKIARRVLPGHCGASTTSPRASFWCSSFRRQPCSSARWVGVPAHVATVLGSKKHSTKIILTFVFFLGGGVGGGGEKRGYLFRIGGGRGRMGYTRFISAEMVDAAFSRCTG